MKFKPAFHMDIPFMTECFSNPAMVDTYKCIMWWIR